MLVRWLGPWAGTRAPPRIERTELTVGGMRAWLYRGRRADGAYLVAPGLHYLGPADPRFDRFCRALSSAGFLVLAPFLPDHLALRVAPSAARDLEEAWRALAAMHPRPAIFSISFGSLPAIEVAARVDASALALFGGYADFDASVRHALSRSGDPTNAPLVFLHLLEQLAARPATPTATAIDREAVARAWRAMVERTWGRPEMKVGNGRAVVAEEIARGLGAAERHLFFAGCLLRPFDVEPALRAAAPSLAFADPRPALARVHCPVLIVHGRDDDVIPWTEADKLRACVTSRCRVHFTGLYGHSEAASPTLGAALRELRTLLAIVAALADAPLGEL